MDVRGRPVRRQPHPHIPVWPGTENPLTIASAGNYSFQMSDNHRADSAEQELRLLEARLEELVATVQQLGEENRALRQRHEALASEKTSLLNRNDQVRARVEAMIGRLKAMETGA